MSIADEIRNMNAKFMETKTAETLKGMSLESLAAEWNQVDKQLKKEATHEDKKMKAFVLDRRSYEKNKKETMDKLSQIITPEILQGKLDEYLVALSSNQFEAADFYDISAIMDDYAASTGKDDIKQRIANIKNKIADKRLNISKPLDLNMPNHPLNYASVNIEADSGIVSELSDKKSKNGKTVTFRNEQGEDMAGIQFNKEGHADILIPGKDGNANHYMLFNDGRFGRVGNDKTYIIEADKMTDTDKKAFNIAKEAENIWNQYAEGKLDDKVEKDKGVNVNEGENEVTVNQAEKETSKVNEFNPLINMVDPTKVNQGTEPETTNDQEGEVGGGDLDPNAQKENEEYWKEGDIIDTMFKWLVEGANSATNFCVHQIEYFAGAVWHQFEQDVIKAKTEETKQANSTQKLYKETNDLYVRRMKETKKNSSKSHIAELLKEGKVDTILAENPGFAALYEQSPNLRKIMSPEFLNSEQGKKDAPAIISSAITMTEDFTNRYAKESILNEKFKNKGAFKDDNLEDVFAEHKKRGIDVLISNMEKISKEKIDEVTKSDPKLAKEYIEKNLGLLISDSMIQSCETIKQAEEINNENYEKDNYDEFKKTPEKNIYLDRLNNLPAPAVPSQEQEQASPEQAPAVEWTVPMSLPEEAEHNRSRDNFYQTIQNGFDQEEANAVGREDSIAEKRRRINEFKDSILQGLGQDKPLGPKIPSRENGEETNKPRPPLVYRGR